MTRKNNKISDDDCYKDTLNQLQIELVKLQNNIIKKEEKILIIFEGRDAGGKDGTIKRITQYLSPRDRSASIFRES
jgi:polyphosphate kinase